jgi:hypothetical protein
MGFLFNAGRIVLVDEAMSCCSRSLDRAFCALPCGSYFSGTRCVRRHIRSVWLFGWSAKPTNEIVGPSQLGAPNDLGKIGIGSLL